MISLVGDGMNGDISWNFLLMVFSAVYLLMVLLSFVTMDV